MDQGDQSGFPHFNQPDRPQPIIVHVDMDCFYAACEQLREPELKGEPVVIGMGYDEDDPHGAVATPSYEAREFGIESAMPIQKSLELLPRREDIDDPAAHKDEPDFGYYRPVDMKYYKSISSQVKEILREFAGVFEPVSIDEAYLDMSETIDWEGIEQTATTIKTRIADEVGVTASIGVAPTKSAAKVASDHDKPDGLVVVRPGEVQEFFEPLPVGEVHGIGPVTANNLEKFGIESAGDLAAANPVTLEDEFGTRGRQFYNIVQGHDPRTVSPPDDPKSLSKESSTGNPITDMETKRDYVCELAEKVSERAIQKNALYQTIAIKVVTPPFEVNTRAYSLPGPIQDKDLVESIAIDLLTEFEETPVRKLGVRLSNLSFSDREQAELDQWKSTSGARTRLTRPQRLTYRQTVISEFL